MTMEEEYKKRRMETRKAQPIIFKLWKLQISYDHPCSQINKTGKEVINVYWGLNCEHWILSKVPGHINFRWRGKLASIPPYRKQLTR